MSSQLHWQSYQMPETLRMRQRSEPLPLPSSLEPTVKPPLESLGPLEEQKGREEQHAGEHGAVVDEPDGAVAV